MAVVIDEATVRVLPDGRMDAKNAATYTGLSEKTLAMMRCNGEGPEYVKLGRIFYFKSAVDEWIAARVRKTGNGNRVAGPGCARSG